MDKDILSSNKSLTQSKKAKALLIALVNLNIIYFAAPILKMDVQVTTQMITSILFLVSAYIGTQAGVEMIQSYKTEKDKNP